MILEGWLEAVDEPLALEWIGDREFRVFLWLGDRSGAGWVSVRID